MLIPGIIGTRTANAITSMPMTRSLLYAAAPGAQITSGANSSHRPTTAFTHGAQLVLRESDSVPNSITSAPLTTSLQPSMAARHCGEASPRSTVTCWSAGLTKNVVSNIPKTKGLATNHAPSPMLTK